MNSALIGYAFALGLGGMLNPCGFPLLPAYLSLFVAGEHKTWPEQLLRALRAGACMTAGFLVIFVVIGSAASSAVAVVLTWVPWLMIVLGAGFVMLGSAVISGHAVTVRLPTIRFRAGRGTIAMVGFGASYALGSLSCSLPLFLAGVLGVFAHASFTSGLSAFLAYGLGMGVFVTAASIVASFANGNVLRVLRPLTRILPSVAGAVLLAAGGYTIFYWCHELLSPTTPSRVIAAAQAVQSAVATGLDSAALPIGAGLGVIVIAALVLLAALSSRKKEASEFDA